VWATKRRARRARNLLVLGLAALCAQCGLRCACAQTATAGTPRLDRLPIPATSSPADIAAIAGGYEARIKARGTGNQPSSRLLIMVSFSMPRASLTRLADQAKRCGGVLVLNGLKDGSLPATAQAIHQTFGQPGAPLQIDPRLFSRYAVNVVPTFILRASDGDEQPCLIGACPAAGYAKASGDVSLDYALEQIANAQPVWRPAARSILHLLEK